MGSNETIKQAVMAGLGIAFISAHTIEAELETGRLITLPVEGLPMQRKWFAVRRLDKALTPAVGAFVDFLRKEGANFLPALPEGRAAPRESPSRRRRVTA
jgi:DNA-binding transcriptional LysR family regulator